MLTSMEKIAFRESGAVITTTSAAEYAWRATLPVLNGTGVTLRELRVSDAPMLLAMLGGEDVGRFVSPMPTTVEGFERCTAWAQRERAAGRSVCFGVVPKGMVDAVGLFHVKRLEPGFATAEWGFALGAPYWGTGLFLESARLVLEFAFGVLGAHRIEARAAVKNGRGNGALRKTGAAQEGVLRRSFLKDGEYLDQVLWAVVDLESRVATAGGITSANQPNL
jgi:[ribosomal protein S5]-alanine N-acetyltransferase